MPIPFTCPHCGIQTYVADEYAGQSGPCASCGRTITIPASPTGAISVPQPAGRSSGLTTLVVVLIGMAVVFVACGGILVAMFLPAVGAAREAARRSMCTNNLKQIGLAMHNYVSQYGCFPPAYLPDKDGKPMHSWRVLLLPYMEQELLYQQYRFDEPWDGPNNRTLASLMPAIYRCPSDKSNPAGPNTNYVVISGPGTVFEGGNSAALRDITDGTANTLLVVEIPGNSIHWMEPKDTTIDGLNQLQPLSGQTGGRQSHPGGFNALLCDGSVRFISLAIDPETLKLLIEKSDGQAVTPGQWQ